MRTPEKIIQALMSRKESGLFRSLVHADHLIDFSSNDYLGLAKIQINENNWVSGAGGSRLISGNHIVFDECEALCKNYFKSESALLFNSGFDANLGLISSVAGPGDIILYDALIHASLVDGMRLSKAIHYKFRHNNIEHLEQLLSEHKGENKTIYVVTESVFSMDGDVCPLQKIVALCEKHNAYLILDEAHAGGIMGEFGEGLSVELNLQNKIFARVITFGKAFGLHGACVLGSENLRNYLINFSRPFIFSTATSPAGISRLKNVLVPSLIAEKKKQLLEILHYFNQKAGHLRLLQINSSPIQIFHIAGNDNCEKASKEAMANGMFIKAIKYPTVASGKERLRICIHNFNTHSDIDKLIEFLEKFDKNC